MGAKFFKILVIGASTKTNVALYELQSLKTAKNLLINITKNVMKNTTHCFIPNGKEFPVHYSTIADVFRDVFRHVYLWSFKVLHFSSHLMCNVTGIVYKVEEFRQPISVRQCFNCQCFGHSAQDCKSKQKCVICGENHSHKGCPKKEAKQPKCAHCSGPHVASYKGCPE